MAKSKPKQEPAGQRVTSEILDRMPPVSRESELGVLGSILLLPYVLDDVATILQPEDFYDDANRTLYETVLAMHSRGQRIDITLLTERLRVEGKLDLAGGVSRIADVLQGTPTAAHAVYYAKIVRDKSKLRRAILVATGVLREAYENPPAEEIDGILDRAVRELSYIGESSKKLEAVSASDVVQAVLVRIDQRTRNDVTAGGLRTGFHDLDDLTGGLFGGELCVLAARPSMGKSALALQMAAHVADHQRGVLFISLEMSTAELGERLLCVLAKVNAHRVRLGTLRTEDRTALVEAGAEISRYALRVDDRPRLTARDITLQARRMRDELGLAMIVVDYLQLIEPLDAKAKRHEQVAAVCKDLKLLAKELDVPIVALAQLNRETEKSGDHRPRLSHLRESGSIEQDADLVMFLHREEYYAATDEAKARVAGMADVIVAKHRNGPTGDVRLVWRQEFTRFETMAQAPTSGGFDAYAEGEQYQTHY